MIKSKIALQYKISIILFLFTILFVTYKINKEPTSLYTEKSVTWEGYISDIQIEEKNVKIILKSKEKLLLQYKVKSNKEKKKIEKYALGSYIKGTGNIEKVNSNRNFNLFSYQKYLWSKKIYRKCSIEKILEYKENTSTIYHIKNAILTKINVSLNKAYYHAFLLGNTSYINKAVKKSYMKNGMSHLLAVSGMHISLLVFLLRLPFQKRGKTCLLYDIFCILFLLFYAFLTNYTPSVMRSTLCFAFITIKQRYRWKINTVAFYVCLTCMFLLYNPYFPYHTGFLYSFIISFFLLCFAKKFCKNKKVYDIYIISSIAFFASFPVQIQTNFEVNILSIFLNIIYVPFVSYILFPLTLTSFFLPIEALLTYLVSLLEQTSLFFSSHAVMLIFPKMTTIEIIIYYILLFSILAGYIKKRYILFLFFLYLYIKPIWTPSFLTMLDVGQGDCFLLHAANKNILIDTAGNDQKENGYEEILSYMKSKGVRKLDAIFLSHGDFDHVGYMLPIVQNFPVKKVILNCGKYNILETKIIKVLEKKKIPYDSCMKTINIGNNQFQFLNTKKYDNENDNSSVIYFHYKNDKFLFMGDAGIEREEDILNKYNIKNIDFFKVGHHGSHTSSSTEFISSINPKYALISVGKNNRYGHPKETVLDILNNSKIYRTDIDGSVEIKFNKSGYKIRTCLP